LPWDAGHNIYNNNNNNYNNYNDYNHNDYNDYNNNDYNNNYNDYNNDNDACRGPTPPSTWGRAAVADGARGRERSRVADKGGSERRGEVGAVAQHQLHAERIWSLQILRRGVSSGNVSIKKSNLTHA
jgi:hypothetical protein